MIYSPMILKQEVILPQQTTVIKGHRVNSITEDSDTTTAQKRDRATLAKKVEQILKITCTNSPG